VSRRNNAERKEHATGYDAQTHTHKISSLHVLEEISLLIRNLQALEEQLR